MHAVLKFAQGILERREKGKCYTLCLNSQAVLKTMCKATFASKQAMNCHQVLNEIGKKNNKITLTFFLSCW